MCWEDPVFKAFHTLCHYGSSLMKRVTDKLSNSRGGSLWNPVGFGLILSLQNYPSGCPSARPSPPHRVGLSEPQTCTTGRHLGSEEGGASVQLLQDSWPSEGAWQELGGCLEALPWAQNFYFMLVRDVFMTDGSDGRRKICFEHQSIWHCPQRILSVFSVSFPFPDRSCLIGLRSEVFV